MKKLKMSKKWLLIALVGLAGLGWYFFGRGPKVSYSEYQVSRGQIQDTLELSGQVMADNTATLRFVTGGLVTYVGAKEGDAVKKWQTLASLDTRQLQKVLDEKLNLYAVQRMTFEQTVDDNDNSVPAGDLANTLKRLLAKNQYQLDNTVKDVEYQDLALKLAKVYSPMNGILVKAPVTSPNVTVLASDAWIVVDPTSLYFSADLDETDLKRVHEGQKVTLKIDAFPDQKIQTTIRSISYSPTETSTGTTYKVKMAIPATDMASLRLGLNGTAAVILDEKEQALLLPSAAITTTGTASSVYRQNGKTYTTTPIKIGIENGGMVEVTEGLSEGERVFAKN
jgi:RND family efflux transporter MFP subunit